MVKVRGTIIDVEGNPLQSLSIVFTLVDKNDREVAIKHEDKLIAQHTTVNTNVDGYFEADLFPNGLLSTESYYRTTIGISNSAGSNTNKYYTIYLDGATPTVDIFDAFASDVVPLPIPTLDDVAKVLTVLSDGTRAWKFVPLANSDIYLGAQPSNPTLDNQGNPLIVGTSYFNTVDEEVRYWTGIEWKSPEAISTLASEASEANKNTTAQHLASIEQIFDNFDDRYLGAKASDPTVDNDGEALIIGAIYFNTTDNDTRFWNGTVWEAPEATLTQAVADALASKVASKLSEDNAKLSEDASKASEDNAKLSEIASGDNATATAQDVIQTTADKAQTAQDVIDSGNNANRAETAEASASVSATTAQTESAKLANYNSMTSLERALPTKAEFEALAEERKANRAGSGFDNFIADEQSFLENINDGSLGVMSPPNSAQANYLLFGTNSEINERENITINGIRLLPHLIGYPHGYHRGWVELPTAPTVVHADASNSGMFLNGRNMVDTSGWLPSSATLTVSNGNLVVTALADVIASDAYQSFQTEIGVEYTFEVKFAKGNVNASVYVREDTWGTVKETITETSEDLTYHKIKFTATTTTTTIMCRANTALVGDNAIFGNFFMCPSHELSRQDLVFIETYHEDISEKNFVYPLGNIQYAGADTDGLTGIVAGAFAGKETYSLFGDWQPDNALVGKGYVWSTMSEADKIAFVSNPENNCYIDGTTIVQVRYRVRVVQGLGDEWENVDTQEDYAWSSLRYLAGSNSVVAKGKQVSISNDFSSSGYYVGVNANNLTTTAERDTGVFTVRNTYADATAYNGKCYALPISLVHRRNSGAYHPKFNPNGTDRMWDTRNVNSSLLWYSQSDAYPIRSIADTFIYAGKENGEHFGFISSAYSGRPDGLYFDEINERDIIDLRNSSHKVQDYKRLLEREFNKAVAGEVRGEEGEWETKWWIGQNPPEADTHMNYYRTGSTIFAYTRSESKYKIPIGSCIYIENDDGTSGIMRVEYLNYDGGIYRHIGTIIGDLTVKDASDNWSGKVATAYPSSRKKSNTLLHCDIIGDPANYYRGQDYITKGATQTVDIAIGDVVWLKTASSSTGTGTVGNFYKALTAQAGNDLDLETFDTDTTNWTDLGTDWDGAGSWRTGVSGTPLVVGENGEDYIPPQASAPKLSKKVSTTKLILASNDNGVTWALSGLTVNSTTNQVSSTTTSGQLHMVFYETHTNMAENAVNSEVLALGDASGFNSGYAAGHYNVAPLFQSLINKVTKYDGAVVGNNEKKIVENYSILDTGKIQTNGNNLPETSQIIFPNVNVPAVKTLPYITKENNKAYLQLVFKEMKFDVTWGDDNKFNIVDNVSTTTDDNANTILIGQKRIALPYFIEDKE